MLKRLGRNYDFRGIMDFLSTQSCDFHSCSILTGKLMATGLKSSVTVVGEDGWIMSNKGVALCIWSLDEKWLS